METITLIIHMTGMLLLSPNTRTGEFPMHVLMPVEGQSGYVPAHIAEIGWRSSAALCQHRFDDGVCYFNLKGWSVELGQGGTPNSGVILPPAGPFDVTYGHRVNPVWFGMDPGASVRSRVSIYSGRAMQGCPFASWTVGSAVGVRLPNVIDWVTDVPGPELTLTAIRLNAGAAYRDTIAFKTFTSTNTVELFLRQEPETHMALGPTPYTSPHLHAFYDLLGYPSDERLFPLNGYPTGRKCPWSKPSASPGAPTCLITIGYPS